MSPSLFIVKIYHKDRRKKTNIYPLKMWKTFPVATSSTYVLWTVNPFI